MNRARALLQRMIAPLRPPSWGLDGLDRKLARRLTLRHGFFVEAGANDGIEQSNTLFFERHRGWHGLLIEPIPELAAQCRRNRPDCLVENVALVPFGHAESHIEMQYCNLMSLVRGAFPTAAEEAAHVARGSAIQGVTPYTLTVAAAPLSAILDRHGVAHVDLLSLDVEGYELSVLQGIDFDRHVIDYMLIEARFRDPIDSFLADRYDAVAALSHHDVLYRRRQEQTARGSR